MKRENKIKSTINDLDNEYLKKLERSWARWKGKGRQVPLEMEP